MRDVTNLAWRLERVLRARSAESILDTYEIERSNHVRLLTSRIKAIGEYVCELDAEIAQSRDERLLAESLEHPDGKVKGFRPDVVGMVGYLISHDAHHRGQICALARQLGYSLPKQATFGMWEWGTRWKEISQE